jgi:hypothetical protein
MCPNKIALLFGALAAFAVAQNTATVEGVVVNKVTGAGIADATVRFVASRANRFEIQTDPTGTFRITGVKPGDYNASVEKTGYFPDSEVFALLGDRPKYHVDPLGDPLRLRLELNPPAVLRGRVIGADGNPARAFVDLGRGRTARTTYTDAEGSFAFDNLQPGPYTLLARPKAIEPVAKHEGSRTEVVPTYYPSVVEPTQAASIVARAGAELSGYEVRLQSVPVYHVRGVVLNPDGKPAAKAVVELQVNVGNLDQFLIPGNIRQSFSIQTGEIGLADTEEPFVTGPDGAFEFPSVRAGEWIVRAEGEPILNESREVAGVGSTAFSLGRGDPDELKIQLAMPFHLSGIAVLSDGSPPAPGVILGVSFYSETGRAGSGGIAEAGGALRLDVIPGAHEIRANVMMGNYYADSILLGSANVTGQRVELTPASPPVKIILKPTGTVRGTIEDASAGTVVLFPQSFTGIGYSTQFGVEKTFELAGIPPGEYYAVALDRFDARTMPDALRLRSLVPRATSVRVEKGSTASVQLRVNRLPE